MSESMTAAEARSFQRFSVQNAARLTAVCPQCEPYRDWYTYPRWQAQGFQVQRGERSTRIPVVVTRTRRNRETGDEEHVKVMKSACVFCRHQVAEKEQAS